MNRPQVSINERHKADAGYFVLVIVPASGGLPADVELHAVLHWGYEKNDQISIPYPITLGGVVVENPHILRPDGAVEQAEGVDFASLDEFRQAVRNGDV
jgi:hypothetical protein